MSKENTSEDSSQQNEEFFDANDVFVEDSKPIIDMNIKNAKNKIRDDNSLWITNFWNRLIGGEDNESLHRTRPQELIISVKDVDKKDSEETDQQMVKQIEDELKSEDKWTKVEIIYDNDTTEENENRRTEVTIVNEDNIEINAEDIEMSPKESINFILILVSILVLNLFIICGTAHWIYNYLEGIDWRLSDKNNLNFHILFMTLGISGFSIALLVHRMFRGWSSGALHFLHVLLTLTTMVWFGIGFYAVVVTLNHLNFVHFYSVHSWLGITSLALFALLWLSAFIIYIFPRFSSDIQTLLIPIHGFFGRVVFTMVCGTAITGIADKNRLTDLDFQKLIQSKSSRKSSDIPRETDDYWDMSEEDILCNTIAFSLIFYAICVNILTKTDAFRRRLLPEEQGIEIKALNR